MDQQRNVLSALEQQKAMMLENHQKERERARLEREAQLSQKSTCADSHHHRNQQNSSHWGASGHGGSSF
jgi:hypothetical protein